MEYNMDDLKKMLLTWYRKQHRDLEWRHTKNPYHIWISEIMLQQTRVEAVKGYYDRFLQYIPDIATLATIQEEELLKLWEGLGYYNRARNLQKAARYIMEELDGSFPSTYDEILKLPGVGPYTAGAIASICFDLPTPAIDGNVLRVMMRFMDCSDVIDDERTKKKARTLLLPLYQSGDCGELTQSLMELGAVVCVPNGQPKCNLCPVGEKCLGRRRGTIHCLPVRKTKKERKKEYMTVFVLHKNNRYGIQKRPSKGLLANMWEFFHVNRKMNPQEALLFLSEQGFVPDLLEKEIPYTHIFTHVEWNMTAYYISCHQELDNLVWVERQELEKKYALPTAFRKFIEMET